MRKHKIGMITKKTGSKGLKTHIGRVPLRMAKEIKKIAAKNKMSVCQLTETAIEQFILGYERYKKTT